MHHLSITVAEEPEYSVPCPIRKAVQKQNLEFLHHKAHFNLPYFQFIKQLLNVNAQCLHQCIEQNKKLTVSLSFINCGYLYQINVLYLKLYQVPNIPY